MERETLERYLADGLSLGQIGEMVGKHPTTVAYWVKKHALINPRSEINAGRGGLDREELERLIAAGLTLREIADRVDRSLATVRHWVKRFGLETRYAAWARDPALKPDRLARSCNEHGEVDFFKDSRGHYRCPFCQVERVSRRRRRVKEILVEEAGGRCVVCGYDRLHRALEFHHRDPSQKSFQIGGGNSWSLERAREEAAKCVLLCGNCHCEVEEGLLSLP